MEDPWSGPGKHVQIPMNAGAEQLPDFVWDGGKKMSDNDGHVEKSGTTWSTVYLWEIEGGEVGLSAIGDGGVESMEVNCNGSVVGYLTSDEAADLAAWLAVVVRKKGWERE